MELFRPFDFSSTLSIDVLALVDMGIVVISEDFSITLK